VRMPLLDFYGEFAVSGVTCDACAWTGIGAELISGEAFGDGVEKHCPACDKKWGFVQWAVALSDDPPDDWRANIGRVET
jgi:hypothetical protein